MPSSSLFKAFPDYARTHGARILISRALLIACVAAITALIVYAMAKGPEFRAALDLEMAQQIAEEDKSFCEEVGRQPATPKFATCVRRLGEIRARHRERILRDLSPIL